MCGCSCGFFNILNYVYVSVCVFKYILSVEIPHLISEILVKMVIPALKKLIL